MAAAGIPTECTALDALFADASGRAMLALPARNELEDWDFDTLRTLLRLNQFRPTRARMRTPNAIDATIRVLRRWKLGSGRQTILRRLSTLAEAPNASADPADAVVSLGFLRSFSAVTESLRQPATFAAWIDRVVSLCEELGIARQEQTGGLGARRTTRRWTPAITASRGSLKDVLYDAAPIVAPAGRDAANSLWTNLRGGWRTCSTLRISSSKKAKPGGVQILDTFDVRNLEIPHLFLAGLSDASFPRSRPDDCLYSESERRHHARRRSTSTAISSPHQDEMLLFYSIVTRARRSLTLSYPAVSTSGQPLFPSPYVTAAPRTVSARTSTNHRLQPNSIPCRRGSAY